jgi:hypothetical protein
MQIIRSQQIDAMRRARRQEFDRMLEARVMREHATRAARLGPTLWRAVVRNMVSAARAYGCESGWSVMAYVDIACALGPAFHRHPAVQAVLADGAYGVEERIGRLPFAVPGRAWREAAALSPSWNVGGGDWQNASQHDTAPPISFCPQKA